jgi:hypothetical protein
VTGPIDRGAMKTTIVAAALLAAGCASAPVRSRDAAPLFRVAVEGTPATAFLATLPPRKPAVVADLPPAAGARGGVVLEIRIETSKGETVLAPQIAAFHGQRANVQVLRQVAFVSDFDVEKRDGAAVASPVVGIRNEGIFLAMKALPAERGTLLSFAARTDRLKSPMDVESFTDLQGNHLSLQLPVVERTEAGGVRALEEGAWSLLARLPDGEGGTLTLSARARAAMLEFSSKDEDARDIALVDEGARPGEPEGPVAAAMPRTGEATGILDVDAVSLRTDLPAGSVLEEEIAADPRPLAPGDLRLATQWAPGARVARLLDEAFVQDYAYSAEPPATVDPVVASRVSGFEASVGEDGVLAISWTTTPRWDRFTVAPAGAGEPHRFSVERPWSATCTARLPKAPGTRYVVLAPLGGGRAAAAVVRFRTE